MAPAKKKNIQTAATAKSETEAKKKRGTNTRKKVQEKSKSKNPTLLRIKLPNSNPESLPEIIEKATYKKAKLLSNYIKIQMANEVLKTVLRKKNVSPRITVGEEAPPVLTEKKPLRKKIMSPRITVGEETPPVLTDKKPLIKTNVSPGITVGEVAPPVLTEKKPLRKKIMSPRITVGEETPPVLTDKKPLRKKIMSPRITVGEETPPVLIDKKPLRKTNVSPRISVDEEASPVLTEKKPLRKKIMSPRITVDEEALPVLTEKKPLRKKIMSPRITVGEEAAPVLTEKKPLRKKILSPRITVGEEAAPVLTDKKPLRKKNVSTRITFGEEAPAVLTEKKPQSKKKAVKAANIPGQKKRGRMKKTVELKHDTQPDATPEIKSPSNADSEDLYETVPEKVKITKKAAQKKIKNVVSKEPAVSKIKKPPVRKRKVTVSDTPAKKTNRILNNRNKQTNNPINNIAIEIENSICNTEEKQSVKLPIGSSDDSRRTSMSSNCLSWTKDISSSSTTTCLTVKSDDFVRIDNKLPVLELNKIDQQIVASSSSSDSESTTSESTTSDSDAVLPSESNLAPLINGQSPNLSVSSFSRVESVSSQKLQQNNHPDEMNTFEKALKALHKVKLMMNSFNLELLNWIGYPDDKQKIDPKMKSRLKIIDQLKPENDIVTLCRQFEDKINKKEIVESNNDDFDETTDRLEESDKDSLTYTDKNYNFTTEVNVSNFPNFSNSPSESVDNYGEKEAYLQGHPDEDDDTLSLFADGSIIGGESCRYSSIISPEECNKGTRASEEYVPLPISNQFSQSVSYKPSKIFTNDNNNDSAVVHNQPNDIFKLPNNVQKANLMHHVSRKTEYPKPIRLTKRSNIPVLMASIFGFNPKRYKSVVFGDICFFNLVSVCTREKCRYPHRKLDVKEVKIKLERLREDTFIREYIMIRNWAALRRLYGMVFVEESCRRELTSILIEMAMDFPKPSYLTSVEDKSLSIEVLETILLHLNKVDLQSYTDLLTYNFAKGVTLCDIFMHTIAVTQNFSRFKSVFINLTKCIVQNNKTFSREVAENIVERLAILPFDEPIAKALIEILKNTDSAVLENPSVSKFEAQLINLDSELYKELQYLKMEVMPKNFDDPIPSQCSPQAEGIRQERFTIDTPELDSMNTITEDLTQQRVKPLFKVTNKFAIPSSSSSDDTNHRQNKNERFQKYRDTFKTPVFKQRVEMRPPMRRGVKRIFGQRNINDQIPKFPRRYP